QQGPCRQGQQQPGRGRESGCERWRMRVSGMGEGIAGRQAGAGRSQRTAQRGARQREPSLRWPTRALRARQCRLARFHPGHAVYFWLKILHVSAMVLWFAGLFFLPRLFAARHRGGRAASVEYFNAVANALFFRLATPAALLAVLSGMLLIAFGPSGAWLVMKLVVVTAAVLLHLYLGV